VGSEAVLVTGAGGFIGGCLVRRLLASGSGVHVLLQGEIPWRLRGLAERVTVHRGDVRDAAGVSGVVSRVAPRVVFHLAAHGAYESQSDARAIFETNLIGSQHVFAASAAAGVELVVNAGSSSEYGFKREPMRETDRLEPGSLYAAAKAAQTHLGTVMARRGPTAVVTLRLFSVYGPWEEPTRLMPTLLRRARAGLPLEMAAPDTAHDFVYVEDVLDALVDVERLRGLSGHVFNLGTGVQSTLRDVVAAVQETVGGRSEVRWGAMPARRWDTDRWQADVSRARGVLGWSARHTLRQGLARMAAWMDAHESEHAQA
jgi:UDP-glucose 4-epimerase